MTFTEKDFRALVREWRESIAEETGEPCAYVEAERQVEGMLEAHQAHLDGNGYCLGHCGVCSGTNLDVAEAEFRAIAEEQREADEVRRLQKEADENHKLGPDFCDCYECSCSAHALGMIDMDHPYRPGGRRW